VAKGREFDSSQAYEAKLSNVGRFLSAGINTSIQTVVWRKNPEPLYQMIDWLSEIGVKRWYLQRLIPSNRFKEPPIKSALKPKDYYSTVTKIAEKARKAGIDCFPKMDMRHNSVFLLTADGAIYTQGAAPGQKIRLGTFREEIEYFDYVSAADHAWRYYLTDVGEGENRAVKGRDRIRGTKPTPTDEETEHDDN
jgi:MoaA/NifB/PqqE/SkfB family radical SAM enzyme